MKVNLKVVYNDVTARYEVDRKQAISFLVDNFDIIQSTYTRANGDITVSLNCTHNKSNIGGLY